jgi:hypothetical protein
LTLEESGHLLKIYEVGLSSYTYLQTTKDALTRPSNSISPAAMQQRQ